MIEFGDGNNVTLRDVKQSIDALRAELATGRADVLETRDSIDRSLADALATVRTFMKRLDALDGAVAAITARLDGDAPTGVKSIEQLRDSVSGLLARETI